MKKLLLSILCGLLVSFSFGQDKKVKKPLLKQNSVKAVEYLNANLKLDSKQRAIVMNAFSQYADNMTKAIKKTSKSNTEGNANVNRMPQKDMHKYMLRFALKRDDRVKECLKKKQLAKYDDLAKAIHPFTLEVKEKKKK